MLETNPVMSPITPPPKAINKSFLSMPFFRSMLEIYLDPNSALFQQGILDQNKEMVLFCAGGVRSALAVKALKNMGYEKISHIEGGFGAISQSNFKIV